MLLCLLPRYFVVMSIASTEAGLKLWVIPVISRDATTFFIKKKNTHKKKKMQLSTMGPLYTKNNLTLLKEFVQCYTEQLTVMQHKVEIVLLVCQKKFIENIVKTVTKR